MRENVPGSTDTAPDLFALLDKHWDEIADSWLEAIRQKMPDAKYSQRPPEEIRANNMDALSMLKDLLQGTDPGTVWERQADLIRISLEYAQLDIDISEVLMAALLLEDVIRPLVKNAVPLGTAGSLGVRIELRRHVHLLARDIVRGYADVVNQHLREQQQRTALMLEMARTVGRSLDLDQVLSQAADGIAAAVGAQHCILYLVGDDGQTGRVWASIDELPPRSAERLRDSMKQPLLLSDTFLMRLAVKDKQPQACYDAQTDPRANREAMRAHGIRSILAVPCLLRDRVVGVALVMTYDEHRAFTEEQIELALGIANTVAPAIENARLYQRVEQLAVLEERTRLAHEIHDDVAQILGALQLRASLLDDLLARDRVAQARASLPELQDMISKAYTELRESVFDLRAMALPSAGFLSSLQEYLADYRLHYDLGITLEADAGAAKLLEGNPGLQVIRIIQEALTNARRHARARHAWVRIEQENGQLRVSVEDDGQGFDPSGAFSPGQPHFGLQAMRERAEKVNGRLVVISRPGEGTKVELLMPFSPSGGPS